MRETIFLLSIVFNTFIFAQNSESSESRLTAYNNLMNYTPEKFKSDSFYKSENHLWKADMHTFGALKTYYAFKNGIGVNNEDIEWLENRIKEFATALFLEEKMILIIAVGGYGGCPDKMIDTIRLKNKKITRLKFCHSCMDSYRDENFIEIFNTKMYALMKIEPPNAKINSFYGDFYGREANYLSLRSDRTFQYSWHSGDNFNYTEGVWKIKYDTLILSSEVLKNSEEISLHFIGAKWVELVDSKFLLKKKTLIELRDENFKLKRAKKKKPFGKKDKRKKVGIVHQEWY